MIEIQSYSMEGGIYHSKYWFFYTYALCHWFRHCKIGNHLCWWCYFFDIMLVRKNGNSFL